MSTNIQWTDETWNPTAGCSKVSEGCKNCYAIKDAVRLSGNNNPKIAAKYEGTTKAMNWTGKINLASDETLTQPLRWTRPRKIFVNSMSDLFHEKVKQEWIDKVFAVMALCPQHTFQILTKRTERMNQYVNELYSNDERMFELGNWAAEIAKSPCADYIVDESTPYKNIWLGVSVENQKTADERIPCLLETPAAIRFLSCEPLLSDIDFSPEDDEFGLKYNFLTGIFDGNSDKGNGIDWVICGGESGNNARPVHPDWVRSIRDQCVAASVSFHFKQWGNWFPMCEKTVDGKVWSIGKDKALSHIKIWGDGNISVNIGKHNAGRFLDGRTWDEFPKVN